MTDKKSAAEQRSARKRSPEKGGEGNCGERRKPRGRPPRLKGIPGWGKTGKKQLPRLKGGLA